MLQLPCTTMFCYAVQLWQSSPTARVNICSATVAVSLPHLMPISTSSINLSYTHRALGRQDAAFVVHALCFMAHVRVWGWHTSEQASALSILEVSQLRHPRTVHTACRGLGMPCSLYIGGGTHAAANLSPLTRCQGIRTVSHIPKWTMGRRATTPAPWASAGSSGT